MVVYDDTSNEPVRVFDSGVNLRNPESFGEYRLTYRTGDIVSPHIAPLEPLFLELQDFATSIRDGGTPRSSAQLGLDVVRTIEAVDASLEHDGARVDHSRVGCLTVSCGWRGALSTRHPRLLHSVVHRSRAASSLTVGVFTAPSHCARSSTQANLLFSTESSTLLDWSNTLR